MQEIIKQITPNIKALIFDLDGTLADTIPLHLEAWQLTALQLGFKVTDEMIYEHSGTPAVKVAEILGEQYNWRVAPEVITEAKFKHYEQIKARVGRVEAIHPILSIANKYYGQLPLALGTGSTRAGAMKSLEDINGTHLFDIIVTASDVDNPKPHPETFLRSAEFFGLRADQCIVFEDGAAGIKAVLAAGMKLIDVRPYL